MAKEGTILNTLRRPIKKSDDVFLRWHKRIISRSCGRFYLDVSVNPIPSRHSSAGEPKREIQPKSSSDFLIDITHPALLATRRDLSVDLIP
jgi:predicted ATPase with chaperone activity